MNKVSELWKEQSSSPQNGLSRRMYNNSLPYRLYCTYKYPQGLFGIGISYSNSISVNISTLKKMANFLVNVQPDPAFSNANLLTIFCNTTDVSLINVFGELCENVIQYVSTQPTEDKAVKELVNQILRWDALFSKASIGGLSKEKQQGLYGELYLLRKLLRINNVNKKKIIETWVGPLGETQDFQSDVVTIEVKTSTSSNPQTITINNERQLDNTLQPILYLYHLSIMNSKGNGETLNELIDNIRALLDVSEKGEFNMKLNQADYLDSERELYDSNKYVFRQEGFYKVEGEFPRIIESDLREGVGDVEYSISLSACDGFLVADDDVFQLIKQL